MEHFIAVDCDCVASVRRLEREERQGERPNGRRIDTLRKKHKLTPNKRRRASHTLVHPSVRLSVCLSLSRPPASESNNKRSPTAALLLSTLWPTDGRA